MKANKSILLITFSFFGFLIQAQTIERISFSSVASTNNEFQAIAGSPYGTYVSGTNGSLTISAEYGKSNYAESELATKVIAKELQFKVFPNPTVDFLQIQTNKSNSIFSYRILDGNGREIEVKRNLNTNQNIDFTYILDGIYYIEVSTSESVNTYKIIKSNKK